MRLTSAFLCIKPLLDVLGSRNKVDEQQCHQRRLLPRTDRRCQGVAQTVFTRADTASIVRGVWTAQSVDISAFAGQSVRIRVEAADAGSASLIEAGFDNVTVTRQ